MASGDLRFGVGFDIESGAAAAEANITAAVRRMQARLDKTPVEIRASLSNEDISRYSAVSINSIDEIREHIKKLKEEWNKMPGAEKFVGSTNTLTARAQALVNEFRAMTQAATTFGQTLEKAGKVNIKGVSSGYVEGTVTGAERINAALDAQAQKIHTLRAQIEACDASLARMNSRNGMFNRRNELTAGARDVLQKRIQLEQELARASTTGKEAQASLERQMREQERAQQKIRAEQQKINAERQKEHQILVSNEKTIANITAKLQLQKQRLSQKEIGGSQFEQIAKEVERLTKKLAEAKRKADELSGKAKSATETKKGIQDISEAFNKQDTYVSRLIKRMGVYFAFSSVTNFISKIRSVTAEFELQRISLGAIIQDQAKANALFTEIKAFALTSPVSILDLTKYTKQLAAYKIGVEDLFETTKRLTDVSVGLGVSMDRIVLMYGQIRATGYLRASEVRQATEAGIPLVEELAKKLSAANGELVKASDVMEMISKREISFEQVKEVFEDMTNKGGAFYQMQEKQGNTLFGMWAKMGDAASVMYDQIGNTGIVHDAMVGLISGLTDLMKHWRSWMWLLSVGGGLLIAARISMKMLNATTLAAAAVETRQVRALKISLAAREAQTAAVTKSNWAIRANAQLQLLSAQAALKAATATNVFARAWYGLKAAFLSNPLGWVIMGLTTIIGLFMDFDNALEDYNSNLSDIEEKYRSKAADDRRKFTELADEATKSADGSKKQKDALDELNRTYGEILGTENLQIERLKAMHGEYQSLIDIIDAYNEKQKKEERDAAAKEYFGGRLKEAKADFLDELTTIHHGNEELTPSEAFGIAEDIYAAIYEAMKKNDGIVVVGEIQNLLMKRVKEALMGRGFDAEKANELAANLLDRIEGELLDVMVVITEENQALIENEKAYQQAVSGAYKYIKSMDDLKAVLDGDWSSERTIKDMLSPNLGNNWAGGYDPAKVEQETNSTYARFVEETNAKMLALYSLLTMAAQEYGFEIPKEFFTQAESYIKSHEIKFSMFNWSAITDDMIKNMNSKMRSVIEAARKFVDEIDPADKSVSAFNTRMLKLGDSLGFNYNELKKYAMNSGTTLKDHRKKIEDEVAKIKTALIGLEWTKRSLDIIGAHDAAGEVAKDVEKQRKQLDFLEKLLKTMPNFETESKKRSGSKSDDRLQTLQKIENSLATIYKRYEDLRKKEGDTKALEHVNELYKDQLAYLNKIAKDPKFKKFNLSFEMPTELSSLQEYRKVIANVIKELKLKGGEQAIIDLNLKIGNSNIDEVEQEIKDTMKLLKERISKSKEAREFYDNILGYTGSERSATAMTRLLYGNANNLLDVNKQIIAQLNRIADIQNVTLDEGIISPDNIINYKALEEWASNNKKVLGDMYDTIAGIIKDGRSEISKYLSKWYGGTKEDETFAAKRVKIARDTINEILKINEQLRAGNIGADEASSLIAGYKRREISQTAQVDFDAFKNLPYYVSLFGDLDGASSEMLTNMRDKLKDLEKTWGRALDPTQLKELQSRLKELSEQIAKRNPFKALSESIKAYNKLKTDGDKLGSHSEKEADQKVAAAQKEYDEAVKRLDKIKSSSSEDEVKNAQEAVDLAYKNLETAQKTKGEWTDAFNLMRTNAKAVAQTFQTLSSAFSNVASFIQKIASLFGDISDSEAGDAVNAVVGGLTTAAEILSVISTAMIGVLALSISIGASMGWVAGAAAAVAALVSVFSWISSSKVRKANKEIERQQKIIEQLEYSYKKLEDTASKAFGADYIKNYNQQMQTLYAKQIAYQKQAEAERSKGKKSDQDKIDDYLKSARDAMDEIRQLQEDLVSHFTGSSRYDAAKEFAQSWLEAKATFASTTDAIQSKYRELIKNMIIEGAAAKVMDAILAPMWKQMENLLTNNPDDATKAIDYVVNNMDKFTTEANNAMEVLWKSLEARGYDMKKLISDTDNESTGIAKSISNATSEEINALTAATNTALYYISPIPTIAADVMLMRQYMELSGTAASTNILPNADEANPNELVRQHLACLPNIEINTAQTAQRLQEVILLMNRIVSPKNASSTHGVNVYLRN